MPGGKHSPPLPPKKVMICVPLGGGLDSSPSPSPNPLSQKGVPLHYGPLLPSQLVALSGLHRGRGHPLQLQYGGLHAPSRIIEELNKTLALSMQRFERSVAGGARGGGSFGLRGEGRGLWIGLWLAPSASHYILFRFLTKLFGMCVKF